MTGKSKVTLTPMQNKFCENVAYHDMTYSDAYRNSYNTENYKPESVNRKASELMSNVNILARIDEMKAEKRKALLEASVYDYKAHMKELEDVKKRAIDMLENSPTSISTALKATELKGKVSELYNFTEKKEITGGLVNANVELTKEDKEEFSDIILRGINGK